jgi:hypothetical protein
MRTIWITSIVWAFATLAHTQLAHAQLPPAQLAPAEQGTDPNARADELENRLHTIQRGTSQLRGDVDASYLRLAAIEMSLYERVDGARITITQENDVGALYRLVEVTYSLDGVPVFHRRDESGALGRPHAVEIHDGIVRPGDHVLSVTLRYVGDGGAIVRYLDGYRFVVRSSHSFVTPPGQQTRLRIETFERGVDTPYVHRLGVGYERSVLPWGLRRE